MPKWLTEIVRKVYCNIFLLLEFFCKTFVVFTSISLVWLSLRDAIAIMNRSIFVYGFAGAPHTHAPKDFKKIRKTQGA